MRRARRKGTGAAPQPSPFADVTVRAACYQVSPYQALCWREAWEDLSRDDRIKLTAQCKIPGMITTFGPELVHRLSADPVRPVVPSPPDARLRAELHTIVNPPEGVLRRCRHNPAIAAEVAIGALRNIANMLRLTEEVPDHERARQQRQAAKDLGLDGTGTGEGAGEGAGEGTGEGTGEGAGEGAGLTPDQVAAIEQASEAVQNIASAASGAVASNMLNRIPEMLPNVWQEKDPGGHGGTGEGNGGHGSGGHGPHLTLAAMLESHPEIKRVLTLAGRLVPILDRLADDKRSRRGAGRSRLENTTEIGRLTTLERASLAGIRGGIVAADTYRRVLEGSALGYQGEDPRGEGPIVICLDQSGSMFGATGYDDDRGRPVRPRQDWAQAVALALIIRASRTGRRVAIVPYHGSVTPGYVRAFARKPSQDDAIEALMVGENLRGGTSWERGLTAALDLIQHAKDSGLGAADIVHITDGEPDRSEGGDAILTRAQAMNVRIHGIAVGERAQYIAQDERSILGKWSHTVCAVSDASHDSAAVQALGRI